ncbi:MAG TPA: hypothetical protein VMU08_18820 [Rhizomicrobium sp.]|nr:hypothetical protein [Rhizomicrobium sp.]
MFFASQVFTNIHVAISLVAIVAGLITLFGLVAGRSMPTATGGFLFFTLLTSLTGFLFPFHGVTPAIVVGIVSCVLLVAAIAGIYVFALSGPWRWIYVVTATMALYLNCFVLVVQAFQKIPALHALAPKGSEPPFAIAQGLVLVAFAIAGYLGVRRFRPAPARA